MSFSQTKNQINYQLFNDQQTIYCFDCVRNADLLCGYDINRCFIY